MLQTATAAYRGMRTLGFHPIGGRFDDFGDDAIIETTLPPSIAEHHLFPGQCPVDEDGLAVNVSDSPALVRQGFDIRVELAGGQHLASGTSGHR